MGDPTVLSTYTAAGVTGALAGVRLRLAATLTYDRVTLDQRNYWDRAFGFELALRR
ncbi:hypothetical protein QEG98_37305 [Myxococcus sp. MxC21-1]|nr:hypothetical protein [Myxococcus sp. MxC21-1]WNZ61471.1 hypothetical protein QEG98_37305 [Myxococcus sp. MxC21-1]